MGQFSSAVLNKMMSDRTYILCPGQGAQAVGMGKDFYEQSPAAKQVFDRANEVLGFDLKALCFTGPEVELNKTNISQPAIYVTSIAAFRAAVAAGVIDEAKITAFAGLSLGEYTALHLGGAFSFEDGLKLVKARGAYMQEAAVATPSGMVCILGSDEATVTKLCQENAVGEVLVPANFNCPGQIVVSGARGACARLNKAATDAGIRTVELAVAGAFHSPLMQSAADRMGMELDAVNISPPRKPVYANVTADVHGDVASMKKLLVQQIVSPVKWEQTMQKLVALGESRFVELAPKRTLAGMLKKINRRLAVDSLETTEGLSGKLAGA